MLSRSIDSSVQIKALHVIFAGSLKDKPERLWSREIEQVGERG
jgi:hypothetical protein